MSVDYLPKCCDLPTMRAGYTNRKAKRWCCKSRRRLRLREVKLGKEFSEKRLRVRAVPNAEAIAWEHRLVHVAFVELGIGGG